MTLPIEDFSPRYVGDTSQPLQHTFTDHQRVPFSLAGVLAANMTLQMRNQATGALIIGTGSWAITDVANGIAVYVWSAADVATAGVYRIQAGVPFPDGFLHFDIRTLEFKSLV